MVRVSDGIISIKQDGFHLLLGVESCLILIVRLHIESIEYEHCSRECKEEGHEEGYELMIESYSPY